VLNGVTWQRTYPRRSPWKNVMCGLCRSVVRAVHLAVSIGRDRRTHDLRRDHGGGRVVEVAVNVVDEGECQSPVTTSGLLTRCRTHAAVRRLRAAGKPSQASGHNRLPASPVVVEPGQHHVTGQDVPLRPRVSQAAVQPTLLGRAERGHRWVVRLVAGACASPQPQSWRRFIEPGRPRGCAQDQLGRTLRPRPPNTAPDECRTARGPVTRCRVW